MKITCRKCNTEFELDPKKPSEEIDSFNSTTQMGTCTRCANLKATERVYGKRPKTRKSPNKFLADLGFVREEKVS